MQLIRSAAIAKNGRGRSRIGLTVVDLIALEETAAASGGLDLHCSPAGALNRIRLAHSIASKILGAGWHYEGVANAPAGLPRVRIVIIKRS